MIQAAGITEHDPRIVHTMDQMKSLEATKAADAHLTLYEFSDIVRPDLRMMCAADAWHSGSISKPVNGAAPLCSGHWTDNPSSPIVRHIASAPALKIKSCSNNLAIATAG